MFLSVDFSLFLTGVFPENFFNPNLNGFIFVLHL